MYRPPRSTRKMANQAIQPVIKATTQPFARPLIREPIKAERIAVKAAAAGVRWHSDELTLRIVVNALNESGASLHGDDISNLRYGGGVGHWSLMSLDW
jgi:hypothetical protein